VLVQSIIDLRHNLGLPVVAEGVDSEDTLNALISLGCDVAPGCHFAPPLPPDQLWRRVRERGRRSRRLGNQRRQGVAAASSWVEPSR
jgi:EAL domain-containing protein (putative c-di-GMP-specific phosphodiesterase class I)